MPRKLRVKVGVVVALLMPMLASLTFCCPRPWLMNLRMSRTTLNVARSLREVWGSVGFESKRVKDRTRHGVANG